MAIAHRVAGIEIRKEFTDSLKRFSDYVDEAGNASSGGPGIYIQLSRRMNAAFGLSRQIAEEFLGGGTLALRDNCTIMELLALQMLEIDLKDRVDKGIAAGAPRDAARAGGHVGAARFSPLCGHGCRWRHQSTAGFFASGSGRPFAFQTPHTASLPRMV